MSRQVYRTHADELDAITDETQRWNRLTELNVIEQVNNVCQTTVLQDAWDRGQAVTVHGWVYGVSDGLLRDLGMAASNNEELQEQLAAAYRQYGDPPQASIR